MLPLSLYIHTPWCVQKCPYCDFNSHPKRGVLPENDYINQLLYELDQKHDLIQGRPIETLFIGGGTPSLFSAFSYEQLFSGLRQRLKFSDKIEITLEANPGTVEQQRFKDYKKIGINRLSLGIQSFCDHQLKKLGRIHNSEQARRTVEAANHAGFNNFNLDLMFGLPEQTLQQSYQDLQQAIALKPTHISWYQLTLEPNTLFHKYPPTLPNDDLLWDIYQHGQQQLKSSGYQAYEVSAYCQPGRECRHNVNYWQFGDYLGLGAGAHSKITLADNRILRHHNKKHPRAYLTSQNKISEQKTLAQHELPFEFMLNALRLNQATSYDLFQKTTGLSKACLQQPLQQAQHQGLVELSQHHIKTTPSGRQYLNNLLELFLSGSNPTS